jgi:hypothetical protein
MWLLGVETIRATSVAPVGAAARAGSWSVGLGSLRRTVRALERQHDREGSVSVRPATLAGVAVLEDVPPLALLVRPNGAVWIESVQPFSFGNVRNEPLADAWARIRDGWPHPEAVEWFDSIRGGSPPERNVPYLDEEIHLEGNGNGNGARPEPKGLSVGVPEPPPGGGDLAGARALISGLALSRRYRPGAIRATGSPERYVRVSATRAVHRLNPTATAVLDACAPGTPADAVVRLQAAHPDVPRERLEADVLESVRILVARQVLRPAD